MPPPSDNGELSPLVPFAPPMLSAGPRADRCYCAECHGDAANAGVDCRDEWTAFIPRTVGCECLGRHALCFSGRPPELGPARCTPRPRPIASAPAWTPEDGPPATDGGSTLGNPEE